ncbi:hypothetical protein ACQJBY_070432 [Aegilops geniculata]
MKRRRRRAPSPSRIQRILDEYFILLLFETPSGFALFHFALPLINRPDSMEDIWSHFIHGCTAKLPITLKEFQTFEDKSSAINQNSGVNESLTQMIRKWLGGKKLAVGKPEYKEIIEERLKIECLYNRAVMEVMWGIQNCMPSLVPGEKSELDEEDRVPMSKGLRKVLKRYDCNVKTKIVSKQIIATAAALLKCDSVVKDNFRAMRRAGDTIKAISGISCEGWSLLEIATALKMIWWPGEVGDSCVVSKDEAARLANDANRYDVLMNKHACLRVYDEMVEANDVRKSKGELLRSLVEHELRKHMKRKRLKNHS